MTSKTNSIMQRLKSSFANSAYKKLIIAEIVGFAFCLSMSFVFHFAYEWLNKNIGIAWLFATNESVWEHSKIIFYPYLIFSIVEYFVVKSEISSLKVYLTAKSIPLILCIPVMVSIFFTYSGIIGKNFLAIDILMTITIIVAMFIFSYKTITHQYTAKYVYLYASIAVILTILIIIFTYYPIHINLFLDNIKNAYGVSWKTILSFYVSNVAYWQIKWYLLKHSIPTIGDVSTTLNMTLNKNTDWKHSFSPIKIFWSPQNSFFVG